MDKPTRLFLGLVVVGAIILAGHTLVLIADQGTILIYLKLMSEKAKVH